MISGWGKFPFGNRIIGRIFTTDRKYRDENLRRGEPERDSPFLVWTS